MGHAPKTWSDLLASELGADAARPVVLIAPSNVGKTTELLSQTQRLIAQGRFAFYAEASAVAARGLIPGLIHKDHSATSRFEEWQRTSRRAVLFLDGVDEIHLHGRSFEDVVHALREIDVRTRPMQLVIATRNGMWPAEYMKQVVSLVGPENDRKPQIFTLEPIELDDVRALAREHIKDIDTFMRAFQDKELDDIVELHPAHVPLFVAYWNRHGRFGTWSEILKDFVEASFVEAKASHEREGTLTGKDAQVAMDRIGAASILMKQPHFSLPKDANPKAAANIRKLFLDWPAGRLVELFGTGLFSHKGESAVRLPQGPLAEFLASRWFARRFEAGLLIDDLVSQLLVSVFGGPLRVPASRRALVGWVSSEVPEIRPVLLDARPEILLYEGDPSRLSADDISAALARVVRRIDQGLYDPWPTKATIEQLAIKGIDSTVLRLLDEYKGRSNVERHLLLLIETGRIRECASRVRAMALDTSLPERTRAAAVSALGVVGTATDRAALLSIVDSRPPVLDAELLEVLVPDILYGAQLVDLLLRLDHTAGRPGLSVVVDRISVEDIDLTMKTLAPRLDVSVSSKENDNALALAVLLTTSWLTRTQVIQPAAWAIDFLVALSRPDCLRDLPGADSDQLAEALAQKTEIRRELLARLLASEDAENRILWSQGSDWASARFEDLEWLWTRGQGTSGRRAQAIDWEIARIYRRAPMLAQKGLRERLGLPQEFVARLLVIEKEEGLRAETKLAAVEREREEARVLRERNIEALIPKRDAIERGADLHALAWAWTQIAPRDSNARGRLDLGRLHELVGADMTDVMVRGLKACWRQCSVPLPLPSEGGGRVPLDVEFGDGASSGCGWLFI